jgi:hypothetical protein
VSRKPGSRPSLGLLPIEAAIVSANASGLSARSRCVPSSKPAAAFEAAVRIVGHEPVGVVKVAITP